MKKNYCWMIVACCFLIQAATTGIYCNCTGLFTAQIINEFNFTNGAFSWAVTLRTLFSAFSMVLCAKFYNEKSYKKLYCFFGLLSALLWSSQILFTHIWQWYIQNILLGFCLGFIFTIPLNLVLKNWFHTRLGFVLGIAMTASGLSGMLINPISSNLIVNHGWRYGVTMLSCISICIIIPCVLFILKWNPGQMHLKPYQKVDTKQIQLKDVHSNPTIIYCSIIMIICLYCLIQYLNSISVYVSSLGMSVTFAGIATSALMIGNLGGKLLIGVLADIIGTFRTLIFNLISVIISFFIFIFFKEPIFIILACFFYGTSLSLASLAPGLVTQECIEREKNAEILGKMNSIGTFVGAAFYLFISYSYDIFGSFKESFFVSIVISIIAIGFILYLKNAQKQPM